MVRGGGDPVAGGVQGWLGVVGVQGMGRVVGSRGWVGRGGGGPGWVGRVVGVQGWVGSG